MIALAGLVILLQATQPPVQQPILADSSIRGTIQGIVKPPDSAVGIPDVQITLTGPPLTAGGANTRLNKTTDSEGRFSFSDVAGGRYTIGAVRDGYFPATTNAIAWSGGAAPVQVPVVINKQEPNPQVTISLIPGGVISGQLRDSQGRPAAAVPITVLRAGYQAGRRILTTVNTTAGFNPGGSPHVTSDRGEYRVFWLPPGEYFVRTDTSGGIAARVNTASTLPQRSYYVYPLFADSQSSNGPAARYYSTRIPVDVVDRDVTGLQGDIHRTPDLKAHITMKGDPPSGRPPLSSIQLRVQEPLGILLTAPQAMNQQAAAVVQSFFRVCSPPSTRLRSSFHRDTIWPTSGRVRTVFTMIPF